MEGYKKIEALLKLNILKKRGIILFIFLFLLNAAGWILSEPSVLYEIGMLVSLVSMIYLIFDYKGY